MTSDATRRRLLRGFGTVGAAAASLALAGCGGAGGAGGSGGDRVRTDEVAMTDELTYEPRDIEVAAGTTVTWETVGSIGHTVTAYGDDIPSAAAYFASGGFETEAAARGGYPGGGNVPAGGTYAHTFETPGEYGYFCIPHENAGMVGTVRVV